MTLSDAQIAGLIAEPKPTVEVKALIPGKVAAGHRRSTKSVEGTAGSSFRLMVRQAIADPTDFSVILGYEVPQSNRLFLLRRHNGDSHRHPNRLEGTVARGFHIHLATERYQLAGFKEDGYAEATTSYSDLSGAIVHMLAVAAFQPPAQGSLL
jgi:hypothetical protein